MNVEHVSKSYLSADNESVENCSHKFFVPFFSYANLQVSPTSVGLSGDDTIHISVTLENLSKYSGDEVYSLKYFQFVEIIF